MNVLRSPFFRPASRPSSPAPTSLPTQRAEPVSVHSTDRTTGPLNRLALNNFRRPSPATTKPSQDSPTPLVRDGSYLEVLSLKLSEAVSRALAQPAGPALAYEVVAGRRPLPPGRGHVLGQLIALELKTNQNNPHLYRAIIRSLHRPLSVLLTDLCAHLLPLLSSPQFHSPPALSLQGPNINPTQSHALAFMMFAQELLETFDELGLGLEADARGDGLNPIRKGLVSIIDRVVSPLIASIRTELMPVIEALETPNSISPKVTTGVKTAIIYHPSIVTLQSAMPIYAKVLTKCTASSASHTNLASFLISLVWKGLLALSNRPFIHSVPSFPVLPSVKRARTPPTPPLTPPLGRFTLKLPPSRPPSPPIVAVPATASADTRALFDLLNMLPRPSAERADTRLAQEAVDEAFEALNALSTLLDAIHTKSEQGCSAGDMALELTALTQDIPSLVALPPILYAYGGPNFDSVAKLLGLSESEYRQGCLSGIGRAEECASVIIHHVMDVMRAHDDANGITYKWLQLEATNTD
ncbi:hypothetical protein AGABI2DRAFT_204264 [Agaricus bisporus var. bisporus H97]|uniref:hypothetical protein n=1 Tax=Agaricus bisporus var. bisporus (strain H97 / ATCC MYA-4626 / FGSC 10389) TaxID=936046 RepID=UPI00029F6CFC|nr:hypothetical protein AGABI2DRAFT_204264 [Agaricus bisporus var. bisporus H97]EKV47276.1 hypothetical protein AGABI2DRAFT_204264 [Agaricus bisporus var. bisporus H97]